METENLFHVRMKNLYQRGLWGLRRDKWEVIEMGDQKMKVGLE